MDIRDAIVDHLRKQYLGPAGGPEEVVAGRPDRIYLIGTLYPRGTATEADDAESIGDDGHDEALDEPIELANDWDPASAAVSFLHDGDRIRCTVSAARYERIPEDGSPDAGRWRRRPLQQNPIEFTADDRKPRPVWEDKAEVHCVWRPAASGWLVTVALANRDTHDSADGSTPTAKCFFQVSLSCEPVGGRVLPYPTSADLSQDPEDAELRLLYRHRRVYGVGHGCSVDWRAADDGTVTAVSTEMLPTTVVPGIRATTNENPVLRLAYLADDSLSAEELGDQLVAFVDAYRNWEADRAAEAETLADHRFRAAADRLLARIGRAADRMQEGVDLLRRDETARQAFRLANAAMREQILQSRYVRNRPGVLGTPLPARTVDFEPTWFPFQLGFQLLALASTADGRHPDRDIVDLLWFPTGGGKTEAYLSLAAFEMIRRRLVRGVHGGGTAVLTRYTLRLLTAQQLQRAATLVCALERLRKDRTELTGVPGFSIGLWVGGDTTPNTLADAHKRAGELRKSQEPAADNPFQVQACPWCGTPLFPDRQGPDSAYGMRTTTHSFELFCPHQDCEFHALLPVDVVDDQIFAEPPTMVVATVDKLARLPWVAAAGSLFGRGSSMYDPPSLLIQDELHLLSGPLGTTVALYEAAVQSLLGWEGTPPKILSSTATIRAAGDQVRGLFGAEVALFPPSGVSADDNFFAETDREAPGRLFIGLMPQGHTQAFATVLACVAIMQAPRHLGLEGAALDAYWTLVAYHNSLRELGRTVTLARDDVESMLRARSGADAISRTLDREGVAELTSNVSAGQLPAVLRRLERKVGEAECVDLLATTNMLSVGIDIGRLGVMLMNGQPKTTSEYIQATSRVGRAATPGLVVTLLRGAKPRDRSHYEHFRGYHEALYRHVEPTSVTPWSASSRERSLRAALVLVVRHGAGFRVNDDAAAFRAGDPRVVRAVDKLLAVVRRADPDEAAASEREIRWLVNQWDERARLADEQGHKLRYESSKSPALLKDFGETGEGWPLMHSMRSVDRTVRVLAVGERWR